MPATAPAVDRAGSGPALDRVGVGTAVEPARLPQSWSAALVALRLASEHTPVVEADTLGAVLLLAEAADAAPQPHPDIAVLETIAAAVGPAPSSVRLSRNCRSAWPVRPRPPS